MRTKEERIKDNYLNREKNNDKLKKLRKKLKLPRHKGGEVRMKILLKKFQKGEINFKDTYNYLKRERADADYQGEIRGLHFSDAGGKQT